MMPHCSIIIQLHVVMIEIAIPYICPLPALPTSGRVIAAQGFCRINVRTRACHHRHRVAFVHAKLGFLQIKVV